MGLFLKFCDRFGVISVYLIVGVVVFLKVFVRRFTKAAAYGGSSLVRALYGALQEASAKWANS